MANTKHTADMLADNLDAMRGPFLGDGFRTVRADELSAELRRLSASNDELIDALNEMLEVFAKPHNETLCEVVSARVTIARAKEARNG